MGTIAGFVLLLVTLQSTADTQASENSQTRKFAPALPGYRFSFPGDHRSHSEYKTEWWYYTGHLQTDQGKKFGFELTFFRTGVPITDGVNSGPWALKDVYMTHFAVSDMDSRRFEHWEKVCRPGVAQAGASESQYKVWTENWSVTREPGCPPRHPPSHHLLASSGDYSIDLYLNENKPPAIHGENGISQKASCVGCASHYYSFTRMPIVGTISASGKKSTVTGIAWMDHEFGSNQLTSDQIGWDWYSIQLDDNSEIMLYVMRLRNGKIDPNSSGTLVTEDGKCEHLPANCYEINSSKAWKSPHTNATYPAQWHIRIPSRNIDLNIDPELADQELVSSRGGISYWEGTCNVRGTKSGKPLNGKAYVELTGYAGKLNKNI